MPESVPDYRRLPGRGVRRIGPISVTRTSCRLFLGPDHLLSIDANGYTEEYRRFYYRDIQAILLRRTDRSKAWAFVLAVLAVVSALIGFGVPQPGAAVAWSIAGLALLLLVIHLIRGPSCQAHLCTAVHRELLPSLPRLPVARRAIALLRPFIEQAQGAVSAEELAARISAAAADPARPAPRASRTVLSPAATSALEQPGSAYHGRLHWWLFSLLLLDAAQNATLLFVRHVGWIVMATLVTGGLAVCAVAAVLRQRGSSLSRLVQRVTWTTLGYVGLNLVLGYFVFIGLSVQNPGMGNDQWRYMEMLAEISPFDTPWFLALLLFCFAVSLGLGLTGMLALRTGLPPEPIATPAQSSPPPSAAGTNGSPS